MTPTPEAPAQQPGWFGRNWKWLVPVGCLVPMLCCGGLSAAIYFGITGVMKSSPAFIEGLARAQRNPEVIERLGTPVTPGMKLQGSIKNDLADFSIDLAGPKGEGTLRVVARGTRFSVLEVETDGVHIDLLQPSDDGGDEDDALPDDEEEDDDAPPFGKPDED